MKVLELVMFYGSMLFPPHHKAADRIFTESSRQTFNTFWHYIHSGKTNIAIENGPFQDVFPMENERYLLLC